MRLVSHGPEGAVRAGVVVGDLVHPLPDGTSVLDLVRAGLPAALEAGARAVATTPGVPLAGLRLAPPLQPPSIRDFMAFEEHVEGALRTVAADAAVPQEWYDAPRFYFTNPAGIITEAMQTVLGDRVLGICDTPSGLGRRRGPGCAGSSGAVVNRRSCRRSARG